MAAFDKNKIPRAVYLKNFNQEYALMEKMRRNWIKEKSKYEKISSFVKSQYNCRNIKIPIGDLQRSLPWIRT